MQFVIELNLDEVNLVLEHLDAGSHKRVRPLIDRLISEVTTQQRRADKEAPDANND